MSRANFRPAHPAISLRLTSAKQHLSIHKSHSHRSALSKKYRNKRILKTEKNKRRWWLDAYRKTDATNMNVRIRGKRKKTKVNIHLKNKIRNFLI